MKRSLESIIILLLCVAFAVGMASVARDRESSTAAPQTFACTREWTTTMPLEDGTESPFRIVLECDPIGRAVVTCDIPGMGVEGMKSKDAAVMPDGRILFRNELGRFVGHDLGIFMALSQGEFSLEKPIEPVHQFFCEVTGGSRP